MEIYLFLTAILLISVANLILAIKISKKASGIALNELKISISILTQNLKDTECNLKNEFITNRKESAETAIGLRTEIGNQLNAFTQTFSEQLGNLTKSNEEKLEAIRKTTEEKLVIFQTSIDLNSKESRIELKENLNEFKNELNNALIDYKERLREQFGEFEKNQKTQNVASSEKLDNIKRTLELSIKNLQDGNEKKLEEMRLTVDEKLQKTLENRLTRSFELVSKNLESVQKGLGEMQSLATGVGDLKKVLSNVKSRGILGEIQLEAILEQILSPEQYQKNVATKKSTRENVEFAICLPGREGEGKFCYLPIDSKFPVEDYYNLVTAFEAGDLATVEIARKAMEVVLKKCAKDIRDKYLDPPETTDFGIMFLPFEGLYAEVVRNTSLIEILQRDFRVVITGPSTLAALLSSLRIGFKTLAIEKRSGEIKRTLQAVKTEFGKFGGVLQKAQDKILGASDDIEKLVGTRTKIINSKLKSFEELSLPEAKALLDSIETVDLPDDQEDKTN
jgi:DNA recombination protein RmuC